MGLGCGDGDVAPQTCFWEHCLSFFIKRGGAVWRGPLCLCLCCLWDLSGAEWGLLKGNLQEGV